LKDDYSLTPVNDPANVPDDVLVFILDPMLVLDIPECPEGFDPASARASLRKLKLSNIENANQKSQYLCGFLSSAFANVF
jgi:hypothetical protein